jgi:transmembrane sensor
MSESEEHLILQYFQGNLTDEQKLQFEEWRRESDENRKVVDDFHRVWQLTDEKTQHLSFDSKNEWKKLESTLGLWKNEKPLKEISLSNYWLRIAASITFFLIASSVLYFTLFQPKQMNVHTESATQRVLLPDGSEVWLNSNSSISYKDDFSDKRELELEGEAFFDVKKNKDYPFVIHTKKAEVRVLGTSFNVKTNSNDNQAEVYVVSGKVSFAMNETKKSILLTPGDVGVLTQSNLQLITAVDDGGNNIAWLKKELIFNKTPLEAMLKTLRVYFKKNIEVKNELLLPCRFTGSFKDSTFEEVLETIELAMGIKVIHQGDAYLLDGAGCNGS